MNPKLRRILLATVDKLKYINLQSHTMREHVLMHFAPRQRLLIKPQITVTLRELLTEGKLIRGHGWDLAGWPNPVAYQQPWASWAWRPSRKPPTPRQAMRLSRHPEAIARWRLAGCPAEKDWFSAYQRSERSK